MPNPEQIAAAKENLDRVADVYWGRHETCPRDHPAFKPDEVVWRVLADYALIGQVPIDTLKRRAQEKVKSLDETPS